MPVNDPDQGGGPLSCTLEFEQSCLPDPCFEEKQDECKPACVNACNECGMNCAATCNACKTACQDDACRRACATQCAECHDGCLRIEDRCSTGVCRQRFMECRKKIVAEWKRTTCPVVCERVRACVDKCGSQSKSPMACVDTCVKKYMKGCPQRFYGVCIGGTGAMEMD
jgi:hypothetical protein